jgi:hypothetical protein
MATAIASKPTSQRFAPCLSMPGALADPTRRRCPVGRDTLRKQPRGPTPSSFSPEFVYDYVRIVGPYNCGKSMIGAVATCFFARQKA